MEEDIKKAIEYLEWSQSQKRLGNLPDYDRDVYKSVENILNELERLQKENEDWQKAYQEEKDEQFNMLTKKCLHCGKDTPLYCEKCYQTLIGKNAELQTVLQNRINYTKLLEKDLFENSSNYVVPKQVIRDKIQEYEAQGYIEITGVLKELLENN